MGFPHGNWQPRMTSRSQS